MGAQGIGSVKACPIICGAVIRLRYNKDMIQPNSHDHPEYIEAVKELDSLERQVQQFHERRMAYEEDGKIYQFTPADYLLFEKRLKAIDRYVELQHSIFG